MFIDRRRGKIKIKQTRNNFGLEERGFDIDKGSRILKDKTLDKKYMYIPNDDKQNTPYVELKLLVEKFRPC